MPPSLIVAGLALLGGGAGALYETRRVKSDGEKLADNVSGIGSTQLYIAAAAGALAGAALGFVFASMTPPAAIEAVPTA